MKYLIWENFKWSYANRKIKNRFTIRTCKSLIIYEKIWQTNTNVIYHFLHLFTEIYTYITFPLNSSDLYETRTVSSTYRRKNLINITCCFIVNLTIWSEVIRNAVSLTDGEAKLKLVIQNLYKETAKPFSNANTFVLK